MSSSKYQVPIRFHYVRFQISQSLYVLYVLFGLVQRLREASASQCNKRPTTANLQTRQTYKLTNETRSPERICDL